MPDTGFNSNSEDESDLVIVEYNHVSDYNPEQILPQSSENLEKIREWLAPTAYDLPSGEFRKHLATHMAGTGSWITSDQTYETWIKGTEDGLLWIQGVPGSGKSVLAASLIEQLRQTEPNYIVLFFFFRQIIDANHKPQALLRDWMHQILDTSPVLQHKLAGYIEQRRPMDQMGMEDLWSDLRMAFSASSSKIFCVADALDEMDQGYDTFIETLGRLGRWRPEKVKVLITSRPVPKLEPPLRGLAPTRLRLQADQVDRDIATFVYHSLERSSIPKDDWHKVTGAVPGRANGIFLYAKLAMDAFLEEGAQLDKVLSQLPEDLNVLYTKLLEEHAKRSTVSSETQRLILQSVTHARRPLRLLELAEMVLLRSKEAAHGVQNLKESKDLVRAACGPLLEILPDETVSVIHHSFTEYLKGTTRSNTEFHNYPALELGATHDGLARACLQYLLSRCLRSVKAGANPTRRFRGDRGLYDEAGNPEMSKVALKHPFAKYAVNNWAYHVRQSETTDFDQQDSCALIATFLNNDVYKKAWLELAWPDGYDGSLNVTNLHIASQVGLLAYTRSLLATIDVDSADDQGKSPLWWAAHCGHKNTVAILLTAGADPDKDELVNGLKPLHQAAAANHADVVSLLLEAGVDPHTPKTKEAPGRRCGNARRSVGDTPLYYACRNKQKEAIGVLLMAIMKTDPHGALLSALKQKQSKLVAQIISEASFDVNYIAALQTPLQVACAYADFASVNMLLKGGADAKFNLPEESQFSGTQFISMGRGYEDPREGHARKPCLHALASSAVYWQSHNHAKERESKLQDFQNIFLLLMDQGLDVNQRDEDGNTPLHYAANSTFMANLLLDAGADSNAKDRLGCTALFYAKSKEAISLLIEKGHADINHRSDQLAQTPLASMLSHNECDSARALLEFNPNCNITDREGNGALHGAVSSFRVSPDLITALIARGANPNLRNDKGIPPLLKLYRGLSRYGEALRALLDAGADINIVDRDGKTRLFRDIVSMDFGDLKQNMQHLQSMIELGGSISTRDNRGRTLLHEVVTRFRLEEIAAKERLLAFIDLGMDVYAVDHDGNTLLHEFATRDDTHGTYSSSKCVAAFEALIDLGLEIEAKNHKGQTVLHILTSSQRAYEHYNSKFTRGMFIDKVISLMNTVNVCDNNGVTPLHISSTLGSIYTKKLLEAGANATAPTHEQLTPMHLAARSRQANVVGLLIDHLRAESTREERKVKTETNRDSPSDSRQWLIDQINSEIHEDQRGAQHASYTPLHFACRSGMPETVNILLRNGAKWDSQSLFSACQTFQSEDRLWRDNNNASYPAVLLADTHRPTQTRQYSSGRLEFTPGAEARMEEIIDMLFSHGLRPKRPSYRSGFYGDPSHISRDMEPWTDGILDYVDTCIERGLYKHDSELQQKNAKSLDITRIIHKGLYEATERSLRDATTGDQALLTNDYASPTHVLRFLEERKYYVLELLQELGVDFMLRSERLDMSYLSLLASHGFAGLVDTIGTAEAKARFSGGGWHAFGDPSRDGLQRQKIVRKDVDKTKDDDDEEESDVEKNDPYEDMPILIRAIQRIEPNLEVVKVLIEKLGVSVDEVYSIRENDSTSALLHASAGYTWWHANQAVPYLIEAGANLEVVNHDRQTPLLLALVASRTGSLFAKDACRALVAAGANVRAVDTQGMGCLAQAGHDIELLQLLLEHGAVATPKALISAIDAERVDAVRVLLSQGLDPNMRTGDSNSQIEGMELPDWDDSQFTFKRFMKRYDNPIEPQHLFALHHASTAQDNEAGAQMVKILLDFGADPLAKYLQQTKATVWQGTQNREGNMVLLSEPEDEGVDTDDEGSMSYITRPTQRKTPTITVPTGYEECTLLHDLLEAAKAVDELLEASNLDVNHRDARGQTLLLAASTSVKGLDRVIHFATKKKQRALYSDAAQQISVLQHLLSLGADLEARDNEGRNALHLISCRSMHYKSSCADSVKEICRLAPHLLNQTDAQVCTPLHCALASCNGDKSMTLAKLLLELGADATALTDRGDSALHILGQGLVHEPARLLFVALIKDYGLDINLKNDRGETPLFGWCRAGYGHRSDSFTRRWYAEKAHEEERKTTKLLQELGADFFAIDKRGRSLLHVLGYATAERFQWFMDQGLDPLLEDEMQQTAIDVAAANENQEVLKLFKRDEIIQK